MFNPPWFQTAGSEVKKSLYLVVLLKLHHKIVNVSIIVEKKTCSEVFVGGYLRLFSWLLLLGIHDGGSLGSSPEGFLRHQDKILPLCKYLT